MTADISPIIVGFAVRAALYTYCDFVSSFQYHPQACYVMLEANSSDLTVTFRRVPYNVERAAQAIEASDMPSEYAEMLRTGTG